VLLSSFIRESVSSLNGLYPEAEARSIVSILVKHFLGFESYTHIVEPGTQIPDDSVSVLTKAMKRLERAEPVQYVTGKSLFYGREFNVSPSVLIPRPETEQLISLALPFVRKGAHVLDLCTGSGCIAWTLFLETECENVTGVDISPDALSVASSQPFPKGPRFVKEDILNVRSSSKYGPVDLIVSNPPYVMVREKGQMRSNVLDYEPHIALFVPDSDPLVFYRAISEWAAAILTDEGVGIVEINEALEEETIALFRKAGFAHTKSVKDIFDKNRFVIFSKKPL